ncbi:acyl-CoA dehydrogenase, N-terminal domain protein [Mycobacterium xenopi 4042]|uniref:Acyl-CoA dehydrogenase, N-terminal domain protein n=1 Tax=Mycobacterium xenopi 4042 TaxID=1299334 RepID=X8CEB3_MYCXE|nr:acyl-CoA dehydrogenase, N-terminal domain protein [Mycobacterium xenopi 4042]
MAGGRQAGLSGHGGARGVRRWGNPDFRYNTIITEETTKGRYSGIGFGLHNDVVAPYLLRLATDEQKQRWLPKFCTGELITAIAMTEPGTGSDLQGIKTRAVKQGDHYVLNGAKTFITNGINSDLVIVVAQTDPDKGAHGFSLLVVERGMEGFERGRHLDKIGLDAQDTAELSFTDVKVPVENLLGEEGKGFIYLMQNLPRSGSQSPSWPPPQWKQCLSRHCNTRRSARLLAGRSAASKTAGSCSRSWRPRPPWSGWWSTSSSACILTASSAPSRLRWPSGMRPRNRCTWSTGVCSCTAGTATCANIRSPERIWTPGCRRSTAAPPRS